MELPADEFGDVILPGFREDPSALHQVGFELSIASHLELDEIGSPSHAVRVKQDWRTRGPRGSGYRARRPEPGSGSGVPLQNH